MRAVDARRFVREFKKECGKGATIWHGKKFLLLACRGESKSGQPWRAKAERLIGKEEEGLRQY